MQKARPNAVQSLLVDIQVPPKTDALIRRWQGRASDEPPSLMQRRLQFLLQGQLLSLPAQREVQWAAREIFLQLFAHLFSQPTWCDLVCTGKRPSDDSAIPDHLQCTRFEHYESIASDLIKDLYVISEETTTWPNIILR